MSEGRKEKEGDEKRRKKKVEKKKKEKNLGTGRNGREKLLIKGIFERFVLAEVPVWIDALWLGWGPG